VYVDGVIPEDGVPGWNGFPAQRQKDMLAGAEKLGGLRIPAPDPALWGVTGEDDAAWLRACCSPHPVKTMLDAPRLTDAWKSVPTKHYILACAHPNPRFEAHYKWAQGQAGWTSEMMFGGHDLMVTQANELSAALQRVATKHP